jgi:hypothetical protein
MLNRVIDRLQDFPTSGTLALRSEAPGARITGRDGREEIRAYAGIGSVICIEEVEAPFEPKAFALPRESSGRV